MRRKPAARSKPAKEAAPPTKKQVGKSRNPWFQQHQAVAVDSLSRLLAESGSSLLTWAVIGIAMALPLCLMLFLQNFRQLNTSLEEAGNISLFMQVDISRDELEAVGRDIEGMAGVVSVTLVSADEALAEFQDVSGFGNALDGLDENPLPALIIVRPASGLATDIRQLAAQMEAMPQVVAAQVDLEWLQRLYAIINLAQRFTVGLATLLALGVVLAIGNTVRLAIENRRDEILVVKLVGGTDAYVSRPFLYTGIWLGVGGGLIAAILALMAFFLVSGPFARLMALYDSDFTLSGLTISDLLLLLVVAGALGLSGAWLSVLRHLRRIEPV